MKKDLNQEDDLPEMNFIFLKTSERDFKGKEIDLIKESEFINEQIKIISKKEIFEFAKNNFIYIEETVENEKFLKNKKYNEVPKVLNKKILEEIYRKYFKELQMDLKKEKNLELIKYKELVIKLEKKKTKSDEAIKNPEDKKFKNFDIIFFIKDFLENEEELMSFSNLENNLYFANLKPNFYKEEKSDEENKEKIFLEFEDEKINKYIEKINHCKNKSKFKSNMKNSKIINFDKDIFLQEKIEEEKNYFILENLLNRINELEIKRNEYKKWIDEKKLISLNLNHESNYLDLQKNFNEYFDDEKKDLTIPNLFEGISFAIDKSENKRKFENFKKEIEVKKLEEEDNKKIDSKKKKGNSAKDLEEKIVEEEKLEIKMEEIDKENYKDIYKKIKDNYRIEEKKNENYNKFSEIEKRKKIADYVPLFNLNENELMLQLNLFYLENSLKENFQNFDQNLLDFNIRKEIKENNFKEKIKNLIDQKFDYFSHLNKIDNSEFLIFYDQFDSLMKSEKNWQKDFNFVPNFENWENEEKKKIYDIKENLINSDEDNFGIPSEKVIKLFLENKTIKYNKIEIKENNSTKISLLNKNGDYQILGESDNLQNLNFYVEKMNPIPDNLKNELIEINNNLEEKNKKIKKEVDQKFQMVPEFFSEIDFFNSDHKFCNLTFEFEKIKFLGNFVPYFDYNYFKEKDFYFFNDFIKNKFGVQKERKFGFGIFFDIDKKNRIQIMPDGNIFYLNSDADNNGKIITHDGHIIEYKNCWEIEKDEINPLLPSLIEIEEEEEIEDLFETKKNGKKDKSKKKENEIEEEIKNLEKKEKKMKKIEKIIIRNKEGEKNEFLQTHWKNIKKNGEVITENFKKEKKLEEKILSLKRSASPINKYPFTFLREDNLKIIDISDKEKVCIYPDNTQFFTDKNGNLFLQKKNEIVFVIKKTKDFMKRFFDDDFLDLFEESFCEILLKDNLNFWVLKKKNDLENPFLVILKNSQNEFLILNGKGESFSFNKKNIDDFVKNYEDLILKKKKINLYIELIHQLTYEMKKIDLKLAKSKKKKKKDIEKNEKLKIDLINKFKQDFKEIVHKIENGINEQEEEMKEKEEIKKEEKNEEEKEEEDEKKKEKNINSEKNDNIELDEKSEKISINESAVFTVDILSGYNRSFNDLKNEQERKQKLIELKNENSEKKNKKSNLTYKEEEILKKVKFFDDLNFEEKLKYILKEVLFKNEIFIGAAKFDLKNKEIKTKDFLNRDIILKIENNKNLNNLSYKSFLQFLEIENFNINYKEISTKFPPDIINKDDISINFDKYQFILFPEFYDLKIFWIKENNYYEVFDNKGIDDQFENFFDEEKNLEIFFKNINLNREKKFRYNSLKNIKLNKKIDILDFINISKEEELSSNDKDDIEIKEILFTHKKNFTKKDFVNKIKKFDQWKDSKTKLDNYFGYLPKKNDKKGKSLILENELYDKKDLIKLTNAIVEKEKVIKEDFLKNIINKKNFENKNKEKPEENHEEVKNELQLKKTKKKLEYDKKKDFSYKYKLKLEVIEKLKENNKKGRKQMRIKEQCSKYIHNYFDSFEGREFIRYFDVPKNTCIKTKEDKKIIENLLNYGKDSQKENETKNTVLKIKSEKPKSNFYKSEKKGKTKLRFKNTKSKKKQMEESLRKFKTEELKKQKEHRKRKGKNFNIYGLKRKKSPIVKSLYKTVNLKAEKNIKYIETEAEVDRRMKTCSMANKIYFNADSTQKIRNYAPHKTLLESKDMGFPQDYLKLKKNLMSINEYNEKNNQDLLIFPGVINFGKMKKNSYYKTKLVVINKNAFSQRVTIRSPVHCKDIFVLMEQGPIACGLKKQIDVEIDTSKINLGDIKEELTILSKHYKYTIPIVGFVVDQDKTDFKSFKIKRKVNMFRKNNVVLPKVKFKTKELKVIHEDCKDKKEDTESVHGTTSKNIPKMYYDQNFHLSLTKKTHEFETESRI